MEYKILEADDAIGLVALVEGHLQDGWELQGGVSVAMSASDIYSYHVYAQALIRIRKKEGA